MDILAWVVIGVSVSFIGLPAIAGFISGDNFISYKDAWLAGHAMALTLALFATALFSIVWAFERVIW